MRFISARTLSRWSREQGGSRGQRWSREKGGSRGGSREQGREQVSRTYLFP